MDIARTRRFRRMLRQWLPPVWADLIEAHFGSGIRFRGSYRSWNEAMRHAAGYESQEILHAVRDSTRAVLRGEAACERDSVRFDDIPYPFPLIATLLRAAAERGGALTVLDFGGSLGSSYHQCRGFLASLRQLRWNIVEQPHFVRCGREEFESEILRFFHSVDEAVQFAPPTVVLASGVLQYLPEPRAALDQLIRAGADYLVLDRTPVGNGNLDILTVQIPPRGVTRANYPCWIFARGTIRELATRDYEEIAEFSALDGRAGYRDLEARFTGWIFRRRAARAAPAPHPAP